MATLPNTSDAIDTTVSNLLQQALNLSALSNNPSAVAAISAAAQIASTSTGGSGGSFGDGTGGPLPGRTPIDPPSTSVGGPITFIPGGFTPTPPSTRNNNEVPVSIGSGDIVGRNSGRGNNVGTTGPSDRDLRLDERGVPGPTCINPTYKLKKIREYQLPYGTGNFNASSGTQVSLALPSDFSSLNPKTCILVAEVFRCCGVGNFKNEEFVGTVQIAESQLSYYYEDCPDGGKRPVIKQFYDVDRIGLLTFGRVSGTNFSTNAADSALLLQSPNWKWSDDNCDLSVNAQISTIVYESFEDYFNSKFVNTVTIENESRRVSSVNLQTSNSPQTENSVSRSLPRSITATCNYNGNCTKVNTGGGGGGGTTRVCPPDLPGNYTTEVPNSKVLIPYTETIISTATQPTAVPDQKCLVGFEQNYSFEEGYTITKAIVCSDGSYLNTRTERVITRSGTGKRWIGPFQKNYDSPDCQCIEVAHPNDSYTDPSDPCGCHELLTETIYIVCPDEPNYPNIGPNSKKSTKVYNLPSEPGVRLVSKIKRADCTDDPIRIYHPLVLGKDIINGKVKGVTKGLFNLSQSLDCYYTSSTQNTSSKSHYYEITDCDSCGKTPYFAVAYGNQLGSGSLYSQGELFDTTTKAVYSQYRLLALEAPERFFKFYTNGQTNPDTKDIYVINYYRNGLSDRLDPGNFEISLAELRGGSYTNNTFTGSNVAVSSSNKVVTLIDNSGDRSDTTTCSEDPYVSYDIVSGSLNNGVHDSGTGSISTNSNITTYGTVYPNLGIIVLDPHKLNTELGFNTVTGSNISGDNAFKLHTAISGAAALGNPMKARNVKYKTTNHYFVRVPAPQANYSNNPTFVTDSTLPEDAGKLVHSCFQKDPQTYITTIGLYNNNKDLIAVAKLSRPVKKTSDNDVLIKIRLNW